LFGSQIVKAVAETVYIREVNGTTRPYLKSTVMMVADRGNINEIARAFLSFLHLQAAKRWSLSTCGITEVEVTGL